MNATIIIQMYIDDKIIMIKETSQNASQKDLFDLLNEAAIKAEENIDEKFND